MFTMMQQSKIEVRPLPLTNLLSSMAQGNLQMPRFQREFVWPVSRTRSLLDSMFKEFPIGTLFFWQAPNDQSDIFRELKELGIPAPQPNQSISFILDGQQRLTSLFAAGNGLRIGTRDYGNVCLDLDRAIEYEANHDEGFEEEIFVSRRGPDNKKYVAFRDVLAGSLNVYDGLSPERKAAFQTANRRFTTYPFSVVWVRDQPLAEVVEIFQRINQGGKRLSSYDLVCANLWTEEFNFRQKVALLNTQLVEKGFGKIDEKIVPQAISLILQGAATQSVQLRLRTEQVEQIWEGMARAVFRAVDFVRINLGVKRASFLPYRGILPVIIYFFYNLNGKALSAEHRHILWQWFWRVSLSERYSANSQSRIAEDVNRFSKLLSGEPVAFEYAPKVSPDTLVNLSMKSTTSALRNTVLCMLALRTPRNFKDGSPIDLTDDFFSTLARAERHRLFPVSVLRKLSVDPSHVHSVCNFAFIPSELNREISTRYPSEYLAEYQKENPNFEYDIKAHLISIDDNAPIWSDDFDAFLLQRAGLIADALIRLIHEGPSDDSDVIMEGQEYDTVKAMEILIRELIDERLSAVAGENYWNVTIPQKVTNRVNHKIDQHLTENPYLNPADYASGRKKLDFCDVANYSSIIRQNWAQFKDVFVNQDNLVGHLDNFRKYRNLIAHSNQEEITDVHKKSAEAAIIWLQKSIDSFYSHLQKTEIENEQ